MRTSLTPLILLTLLLFGSYTYLQYNTVDVIEITVTDKERITTGSGQNISSKFLVYTENGVFENTDSVLFLKFNSADVQNQLKVDSTYTVKVNWFRIPLLSSFRNILEIVE